MSGVVLQKVKNQALVRSQLDVLFSIVNHADETERAACALAFGYVSTTNLEPVLEKIRAVISGELKKRTSSFNVLNKDKAQNEIDDLKSTLVLCLGYSAAYADLA
jgi:hypothetical protein